MVTWLLLTSLFIKFAGRELFYGLKFVLFIHIDTRGLGMNFDFTLKYFIPFHSCYSDLCRGYNVQDLGKGSLGGGIDLGLNCSEVRV